jgi:transcription antitermination factor NusG
MSDSELYNPLPWFAFRVQSRFEKRVAAMAESRGFESFLPLVRSRRTWSDRSKSLDLPLLPGYVFCRVDPKDRLLLLTIPGVLHIVGRGKLPVAIDEMEIRAMKAALASGLDTAPCPFLRVGQRVRLENGPLAGLDGFLVERSDRHQLVVSITLLQCSVVVEIKKEWVRPANSPAGNLTLSEARIN